MNKEITQYTHPEWDKLPDSLQQIWLEIDDFTGKRNVWNNTQEEANKFSSWYSTWNYSQQLGINGTFIINTHNSKENNTLKIEQILSNIRTKVKSDFHLILWDKDDKDVLSSYIIAKNTWNFNLVNALIYALYLSRESLWASKIIVKFISSEELYNSIEEDKEKEIKKLENWEDLEKRIDKVKQQIWYTGLYWEKEIN